MANLFNLDIGEIKHNGNKVVLMKLNGTIIYEYEDFGFSLIYTVHNDMDGGIGYPFSSREIPQLWIESSTSDSKEIFVTKLDGTVVDVKNDYLIVDNSTISKIQIYYLEDVDNIRFEDMDHIKTIDYVNISNLTSFVRMFDGCNNLESVNTKNWDTSNVTTMSYMFNNCSSLTELNLNNFDMTNVTSMNYMFSGCNSLHTLRLNKCNNDTISKIINSSYFPTNAIEGVTRTIYCKESEAAGLVAPTNWVFSYVD